MPNKLKWTSKASKPYIAAMHAALLSKEWGDIFSPGFDPTDIDFKAFHESNDDWENKFSLKQVRENLTNWIGTQVQEHGRAGAEANELAGRVAGLNLGTGDATDVDVVQVDGSNDDGNPIDPKKVQFPTWMIYYKDIRTSDEYCSVLALIPRGDYYARIDGRTVRYEVVADNTLYDVDQFLNMFPAFNTLDWGSFMEVFGTLGRLFIDDQLDYQHPDRIRQYSEQDVKWDCEQNFVSRGGVPAWFDFLSPAGNRFLLTTVVKARENSHRHNAGARMSTQMYAAAPQVNFYSQPMMQPNMQGINQPTVNQPTMQQQTTPQQNNLGVGRQSPYQFTQQHQQHYHQQQQTSPAMNYASPPPAPMPANHSPFGPSTNQTPNSTFQQYGSPAFYQAEHTPVQQQYSQRPMPMPMTYFVQQPTNTMEQPYKGHYPTPGVPAAAGRSSANSEYTEVTVEETSPFKPTSASSRKKPPPSYVSPPIVETINESPSAKETPVKKKSYFTKAMDYVRQTGNNNSSDESSHMKHPTKYYAQSAHHRVEDDSSSSI